jgi:GNAT superfamily N-acetyltransferase
MLQTVRQAVSELGAVEAALYLADRLLGRVSRGRWRLHRYALVVQPLQVQERMLKRGGSVQIRSLSEAESRDYDLLRPREVIDFRYGQNAHCIAALQEDTVVGFIWVMTTPYREDEVDCWFHPEPAGVVGWDFDVYVDPKFRVGTLMGRLWAHASQHLLAAGCHASASRIATSNRSSIAAHRRMGAERVGNATFLKLGSFQLAVVSRPFRVYLGSGNRAPHIAVTAPGEESR